ncbi:MAG: dTDP-4-dehydrorhamnose 3,5-epimerase [Chthoniobacterales bacterium]|nr:dTDP-4-dehydrorhamnose 3,5-epimerase [Chthoniobacterales bacterium]
MTFTETPLAGAFLIELELHKDERGFFARTFCRREFEAHGLNPDVVQCNTSYNHKAGTIRGMHRQKPPAREAKLVRCVRGAIYDVIVDVRPKSPTYGKHFAAELTADNRRALYVPESFAHGFQTLEDNCEIEYQMSEYHSPGSATGYRYDDAALAITWPLPVTLISALDLAWPSFF